MRPTHISAGGDRPQNGQDWVIIYANDGGWIREVRGIAARRNRRRGVSPRRIMSLTTIAATVRSSISRYRNYRRAVRELSQLDDRQLCDIGIVRSRIEEVARGAAH